MEYQYRVALRAYLDHDQIIGHYEFTAANDQEAAKKVGTIGAPYLEVFDESGKWFALNLNANIEVEVSK